MAIRMIRNYFRILARDYLKQITLPIVHQIMKEKPDFEIDPSKGVPPEKIKEHANALMEWSQKIFDIVVTSIPKLPLYEKNNFLFSHSLF